MWLSFRTTWRPPLAQPLCLATYAQAKHQPLYVCNFLPYNNLHPTIGSLAQFRSGVWRNSVREFGAVPFGSLAAKLTILSVFYCIPYVLLFFFKTSAPFQTLPSAFRLQPSYLLLFPSSPLGETERGSLLLILVLPSIQFRHFQKFSKLLHPLRLHLPSIKNLPIRLQPLCSVVKYVGM